MEQVVINCRPPKRFIEVGEQWQWDNMSLIIPAVESVAGLNPTYKGPTGLWFGMVRGSDKTSSIARTCNWCLAFSPTRLSIFVGAADIEQAQLVRNAMVTEARLNPWFGELLKIDQYKASGPGGELEILSSEPKGAYGKTGDIFICDEITHWKDEAFWTSLYSGEMKRRGCLFFVLSNAGYHDTWQHRLYEDLKNDPSWKVSEAPGVQASWVDMEKLERARKRIPETEARRLYDNQWVPAGGNVVFPHEDVQKIFSGPTKHPQLNLMRFNGDSSDS